MIEVYCQHNVHGIVYAREGERWWCVPCVSDGWARRTPWEPSPAVARMMATEANRVTFYGLPWLAQEAYGIPADRVAVVKPSDLDSTTRVE